MSTTSISVENSRTHVWSRVLDYVELTKPRIALLVLITVIVAAVVACWAQPNPWVLLHALIGTSLIASSASALNHYFERHSDAKMQRTADRPLPAGRLSAGEVFRFGIVTILGGLIYLAWTTSWLTTLCGALTWALYVVVYTPLKYRTTFNTFIGAIAGAMPILIGWTAVGGRLDQRAAAMFLIVFLWQFPHFMAIAWLYRRQYAEAGMKMLPVVEKTGRAAGIQAVATATVLLPISFMPALAFPGQGRLIYLCAALGLGTMQLACAVLFLQRLDDTSARRLLRASLVYLPVLMLMLMVVPLV